MAKRLYNLAELAQLCQRDKTFFGHLFKSGRLPKPKYETRYSPLWTALQAEQIKQIANACIRRSSVKKESKNAE